MNDVRGDTTMYDVILVRYGEIGLKGRNRSAFENQLVTNVRRAIHDFPLLEVHKEYGHIVVDAGSGPVPGGAFDRIQSVFGVVSLSPAMSLPLSVEALSEGAKRVMGDQLDRSPPGPVRFKVDTRRPNKRFPLKTPEINARLGEDLLTAFDRLSVDVHTPEVTLFVEVRDRAIYAYTHILPGPGGLPVGSSSRGLLLLSGGIDSPVAGWMAMKRGVQLHAVYFHSFPFTSERAKEKVIDLAQVLSRYAGNPIPVHVVPFTDVQQAIKKEAPKSMGITIMRRMMLRIADRLAESLKIPALITGESVGQVASQTLESMAAINAVTSRPILRPLVTLDKSEIVAVAKRIGTYEISILPYEDCCTLFVPERPETKPRMDRAASAEAGLDVDHLVQRAVQGIDRVESRYEAGERP